MKNGVAGRFRHLRLRSRLGRFRLRGRLGHLRFGFRGCRFGGCRRFDAGLGTVFGRHRGFRHCRSGSFRHCLPARQLVCRIIGVFQNPRRGGVVIGDAHKNVTAVLGNDRVIDLRHFLRHIILELAAQLPDVLLHNFHCLLAVPFVRQGQQRQLVSIIAAASVKCCRSSLRQLREIKFRILHCGKLGVKADLAQKRLQHRRSINFRCRRGTARDRQQNQRGQKNCGHTDHSVFHIATSPVNIWCSAMLTARIDKR